mmetsp:Transcript_32361/g.70920  ORF Transcript_32361/g.70920 Transcript_32361/m.70920 type:complete len:250 (-) Transcript_32361:2607-3356(-)
MRDEFVVEALVLHEKVPLLVRELIASELWKLNVYPLLKDFLSKEQSVKGYLESATLGRAVRLLPPQAHLAAADRVRAAASPHRQGGAQGAVPQGGGGRLLGDPAQDHLHVGGALRPLHRTLPHRAAASAAAHRLGKAAGRVRLFDAARCALGEEAVGAPRRRRHAAPLRAGAVVARGRGGRATHGQERGAGVAFGVQHDVRRRSSSKVQDHQLPQEPALATSCTAQRDNCRPDPAADRSAALVGRASVY